MQPEKKWLRACERNIRADTKVSVEEREEVPAKERRSPATRGADYGEDALLLQPMEISEGAETHLQPMEERLPTHSRWTRAVNPWETLSWSRLQAETCTPVERGAPCWSRFPSRTCDPLRDPHWNGCAWKAVPRGSVTHAGTVCEEPLPMR